MLSTALGAGGGSQLGLSGATPTASGRTAGRQGLRLPGFLALTATPSVPGARCLLGCTYTSRQDQLGPLSQEPLTSWAPQSVPLSRVCFYYKYFIV